MGDRVGSSQVRDDDDRSEAVHRSLAVRDESAPDRAQKQSGGVFGVLGRASSSALGLGRELGGSAQRITRQFVSEAEHLVDVALTSEAPPRVVVHGEVVPEDELDDDLPEVPQATADQVRRMGDKLLAQSAEARIAEGPHPAFERILAEITPDEARILRLMYRDGAQPAVDVRTNRPFGVGSETVAAGLSMISEIAGCRDHDRIASYLGNLHRLGLIWFSKEQVDVKSYELLQVQPHVVEAISNAGRYAKVVRRRIEMTPFGRDFFRSSFTIG